MTCVIQELNQEVRMIGEPLEGNCFYRHRSNFQLRPNTENLRRDLKRFARSGRNILEIGTNAGHSLALMNEGLGEEEKFKGTLTGIDKCFHKYTSPCMDVIWEASTKSFAFLEGTSEEILPLLVKSPTAWFDRIHIDGGHGVKALRNDIELCFELATAETLICIDDTNFSKIKNICDEYVESGLLREVSEDYFKEWDTRFHRLYEYIFN